MTAAGIVVWRYVSPVTGTGPLAQGDPPQGNAVFRAYRYGPDHPGLAGKDLSAGDPIEQFVRPVPAPDGTAGTVPLTGSRVTAAGDRIRVEWDTASCPADDSNLIFGNLADVSSYALLGAECAIGILGAHEWYDVPAASLFFLVVGVDDTGIYESRWGAASTGAERHAAAPSNTCGVTTKDTSMACP